MSLSAGTARRSVGGAATPFDCAATETVMSTENPREQKTDASFESTDNGLETVCLRCAHCGHEWEYIGTGEKTTCPSCRETFPVHVANHYALLHGGEWTPTVRLEVPERIQRAVRRRMQATDATEDERREFLHDYLSVRYEFVMAGSTAGDADG